MLNIYQTSSLFKIFIFASVLSLGACSSFQNKSEKLSKGIQKAYAVPSSTANRISPLIVQHAEKHDVPATIIAAVIHQESSYRANAKSSAGAVGLMQIIPRYWQESCPGDLYNETININCGSWILSRYHQQAGNWKKALGYYNVGPSGYENNSNAKKSGKKYYKSVKKHEKTLKKEM